MRCTFASERRFDRAGAGKGNAGTMTVNGNAMRLSAALAQEKAGELREVPAVGQG